MKTSGRRGIAPFSQNNAYHRAWSQQHRNGTKAWNKFQRTYRAKRKSASLADRRRRKAREMLAGARARAKEKGLRCTIRLKDIVMTDRCPITGRKFNLRAGPKVSADSPSLDRVHPHKHYVPGNVWVVSFRANRLKGTLTPEQVLRLADYVVGVTRAWV